MQMATGNKDYTKEVSFGALSSGDTSPKLSQFNWIAQTGTRIIEYDSANNQTVTLHTVSAGKTFFLLTAVLSFALSDSQGNRHVCYIDGAGTHIVILEDQIDVGTGQLALGSSISVNFSPPLRFDAAEKIEVVSTVSGVATEAAITGYEVDDDLFP